MASIVLRSRVGKDGILKLQVPDSMREKDVDIVLSVANAAPDEVERDALGWPKGFFAETAGYWKGEPLVRPPQLPLDDVEFGGRGE